MPVALKVEGMFFMVMVRVAESFRSEGVLMGCDFTGGSVGDGISCSWPCLGSVLGA